MANRLVLVNAIAGGGNYRRPRGNIDFFSQTGGGNWWDSLLNVGAQILTNRFLGPQLPVPRDQFPGEVARRLPQDLPVPSPPVIGFPYPTPRDINPFTRRKSWLYAPSSARRRKRMQCTNLKALNRAISRVKCFQKIVKKSHAFNTLTAPGPVRSKGRKCKCQ